MTSQSNSSKNAFFRCICTFTAPDVNRSQKPLNNTFILTSGTLHNSMKKLRGDFSEEFKIGETLFVVDNITTLQRRVDDLWTNISVGK